jgi:flavin-dependent dehydrogenase
MTEPVLRLGEAASTLWDVIILGAGPSGAVAACELSRRGAQTLLVDKHSFPRGKVCGACLNGEALRILKSLGLEERLHALGGIKLEALQLNYEGRLVRWALPAGLALSRDRLDAAVVDLYARSGEAFLPGTEAIVGSIQGGTRQVFLRCSGQTLQARARVVMVATGLGPIPCEARALSSSQASPRSRIGAGCTVEDFPDSYRPGTIHMCVAHHGYVGLVRVEEGLLNVASALDKRLLKETGCLGAAANRVLIEAGCPPLPALARAAWRGTPALTRRTRPIAGERLFVLGDASGYIEPFTGEGMAWAMTSAQLAAPLAWRALKRWEPSLARTWISLHHRLLARRQLLCRALAVLLRHPPLARAALALAGQVPILPRMMIARLSAASTLAQTS